MKITAEEFNKKYPIGTTVLWFPVDEPPILATRTASEAMAWASGDVVIKLEGVEDRRIGGPYIKVDQIEPYDQKGFYEVRKTLEQLNAVEEG